MTARADIVTRITTIVAEHIGADPATVSASKPLSDQTVDSLDIVEIGMAVEETFGVVIEPVKDWTIDKIADAVIAAKETART